MSYRLIPKCQANSGNTFGNLGGFHIEGIEPEFQGLTGYSGNGQSTTGQADMQGDAYDWGLILPEAVAKNEIFKIGNQRYRVKFNKDNKPYLEDRMGNLIPFDYNNYVQTGWDEVNKVRTFRQKPQQTTSFEVDDVDYSGLESLGDFYDWANKTFEGIPYKVVDNGGNSRYVIMPWDSPDDPLTTKYYQNSPISQETLNALKLRAYSENPENRVYITQGKTAEEINAENANRALASMDGLTIGMNADSSPSGQQLNNDMRASMAGTNANLYYMPFIAGGAPVNIGFAGLTGYELVHNPYWMQKTADYWNNGQYGQAVLSGLGDAAYGTLGFLPALQEAKGARQAYNIGKHINTVAGNSTTTANNIRTAFRNQQAANAFEDILDQEITAVNGTRVPTSSTGILGPAWSSEIYGEIPQSTLGILSKTDLGQTFNKVAPITRIKLGDIEINDPNLAYRQGGEGVAQDFINTGQVRSDNMGTSASFEVPGLGKFDFSKNFSNPMFKQGGLWYGIPEDSNKVDLLVTAEPLSVATKSSRAINPEGISGTFDVRGNGTFQNGRRVPMSEDQLNLSNTSAYTWQPEYGYRKLVPEESVANWYDWATAKQGNVLGEAPVRNYNGDIIGERFGELVSDAGSEKMIYADAQDPNYVLKVYDAPFDDMSREFTANPLVNETQAGWVTTPDGKYYRVTRQPRYSNIPSDLTPEQHNALARMLKENGWDPYMANGEVRAAYKDGQVMNDFYQNVAFDGAGNPVLIDNNVIPATEGWNKGLTRWEVPVQNPMERRPINKPENAQFTYWTTDPELEAFAKEFTSPEGEYGQYIKRMTSVPEDDPFGIPSILTENDPTNIVDFLLFGASDEALNRLGVTREQLNGLDSNFYKLGNDLAKYGGPLTSAQILQEIPKAARTPEMYSPQFRGSLKQFFEEISWPKLVRNLKESHNIDLELPQHKALRDELWELWSDPMKGVTFENGYVDPRYGGYSQGPHYIRFPFDYSPDRYTLAHELHHSMRNRFKGIMANHGLKPDFPLSENDILASLDSERYKTQIPSEYFIQERNAMRKMAGFSPEDRRVLTPDAEIGATAFETNMNLYDLYYDTYGKYPSLEEFESFIDNMAEEGKLISYTKDISYAPRFNSSSALINEMDYWGKIASGEIPLDEALALEGEFKNYQLSQNKDPQLAKWETETEIANQQDRNYAKLLKALASTMFATYLYNKSE